MAYLKGKKAGENPTVVLVLAIPSCLQFPVLPLNPLPAELQTLQEISVWGDQCPGAPISSGKFGCVNITHKKTLSSFRNYFLKTVKRRDFFFGVKIQLKKKKGPEQGEGDLFLLAAWRGGILKERIK